MARVAYTLGQDRRASQNNAAAVVNLALVPIAADIQDEWSIDHEPMGADWHDSSWLLRKGLDVIEGVTPDPLPLEWKHKWLAYPTRGYNTSDA
jgi:hypothetical protein